MQRGLLIGLLVALTFTATASAGLYAPPPPDTRPVWSPDGRAVAYYRGGEGLHVVDPDGTHDRLLAGVPNSPAFAFSNDWRWLALAVFEGDPGLAAIEVMRPDGSESRVVAHGACCAAPVFSADGSRLAYADGGGISIVGVGGGDPVRVATQAVFPRWSPDGRLSYSVPTLNGPHVVVNALDGSTVSDAGATASFGAATTRGATWSRDGRLAFVVGTPARIAISDAAGKLRAFRVDSAASLEWSPDGTRILFSGAHGLSVVDVSSGRVSMVAPGTDGAWSPDGARIAYAATAECGDRAGIYVDLARITNDCSVFGTEGPDTLRADATLFQIVLGLGGDDTLVGGGAPYIGDALDGGPGNDRLEGGPWFDRLTGGPGNDILHGGAGSDVLLARDGEADLVDCGKGVDKAYVDSFDLVVHCEKVFRSR